MLVRHAASLVMFLACLSLAACGDDDAGSGPNDPPGTTTDGGTPSGTCATSADCPGALVCDPATSRCTDSPVSCTGHGDCSGGAFCAPTGVCQRSETGGPCEDDSNCPQGEVCTGGFCGCEGEQFVADVVSANVLIVLDKSGSMDDEIDGTSKWDIAVEAIDSLLDAYGDGVRFGLVLYPDGDRCGAGEVQVDVGDGTAEAIRAAIAGSEPDGSTPIGDSLAVLDDYAGLEDPMRANYVLLITDGEERCDGDGEDGAAMLRAQTPEIKTFVVGFGGEVDPEALNSIAVAGGTDLPGDTKYYQADDAASLSTVFADVAGSVLSCTYELSDVPPDVASLYVYFDGSPISQDPAHANGWDYNPDTNQLTFYGTACEGLQSGMVTDLVVVHGCAPIII